MQKKTDRIIFVYFSYNFSIHEFVVSIEKRIFFTKKKIVITIILVSRSKTNTNGWCVGNSIRRNMSLFGFPLKKKNIFFP